MLDGNQSAGAYLGIQKVGAGGTAALRKLALPKDLLLYSRDEFERIKDSAHHIIGRTRREGRVLHERT